MVRFYPLAFFFLQSGVCAFTTFMTTNTKDRITRLSVEFNGRGTEFKPQPPKDPPSNMENNPAISFNNEHRNGRDTEEEKVVVWDAKDLTLDQNLSQSFATKTMSILSRPSGFVTDIIQETKDRTEKRQSRAYHERTKAADKLRRLQRKYDQAVSEIEVELREKLAEQQTRLDEDMDVISRVLQAEIQSEVSREGEIVEFMDLIKKNLSLKLAGVTREEGIILEMQEARSKIKTGSITSQLDEMLVQKISIVQTDLALVADMNACIFEVQSVLDECQRRSTLLTSKLINLSKPMVGVAYAWSTFDDLEAILKEANESAFNYETRLLKIQERMNERLTFKSGIIDGSIPPGAARFGTETTGNAVYSRKEKFGEYGELGRELAKSVGNAAFGGSKAALAGLKTFFDTVTDPSTEN